MLKEYRIRNLKEYIASAESLPQYYADALIKAKKMKAIFEVRLESLT